LWGSKELLGTGLHFVGLVLSTKTKRYSGYLCCAGGGDRLSDEVECVDVLGVDDCWGKDEDEDEDEDEAVAAQAAAPPRPAVTASLSAEIVSFFNFD